MSPSSPTSEMVVLLLPDLHRHSTAIADGHLPSDPRTGTKRRTAVADRDGAR